MGKALYRKYRPKCLAEVIGEDQVVDTLKKSLEAKNISHAYLFVGPRGCGKTSVARIFAHEINQFKYELEDNYVDIIEIDAASNNGVDNIRDLREEANFTPAVAKYREIIREINSFVKGVFFLIFLECLLYYLLICIKLDDFGLKSKIYFYLHHQANLRKGVFHDQSSAKTLPYSSPS